MAGSRWTCERCGSANDAAAPVCGVCGEPAPPPERNRSRALWALLMLALVAAAAVGATVLIASRHHPALAPAVQLPVYTTPVLPSTANAVPSTTTEAPLTASPTSPEGPPCPAAAAQYLPGGAGTALLVAQTEKSLVTVCQTADGRLFYDGQARGAAASGATHISLPAQRSDSGFVAANGEYHYTISGGRLVVSTGSRVLSDDPLTPVG